MLLIKSWVDGRWEPIFFSFIAMAFASNGPIQMGSPVLFDKSIRRTTNPFEVESNVKNFTFISTNILFSFDRRRTGITKSQRSSHAIVLLQSEILFDPFDFSVPTKNRSHHFLSQVNVTGVSFAERTGG